MFSSQFKSGNVSIFNEKKSLTEFRCVDSVSKIGLYISESLLFLGVVLILLNNLNVISPGNYFGAYSWVTVAVFSIGICINFISIPFLYFSSLKNFLKESDFWDKETFWILPLFFFGTFFIYSSLIQPAFNVLIVSIITIACIHIKFVFKMRNIGNKKSNCLLVGREQYATTLMYLSVYYILLFALLVIINPLNSAFFWIRLHA